MSLKQKPSISVFFPAYNDGGTIASMVISSMLVLEELTDDYEIIVIDDGSADYTPEVLDRLAEDYSRVHIIHHLENKGYGGVLRAGFASATKDLIFYTDGDAQYDVRDLLHFYPLLTDDVDMVQGYKKERHDPWYRIVIGMLYRRFVKMAFNLKVDDVDCDFRLMRRRIFDKVAITGNSGIICLELMKKVQDNGFTVIQEGVSHYERVYGRSQFFSFYHISKVAHGLIELWIELVLKKKHLNPIFRNTAPISQAEAAR